MRLVDLETNDEPESSPAAMGHESSASQDCDDANSRPPIVQRKRVRIKRSRPRKRTIAVKRITLAFLRGENAELGDEALELAADRPRVRSECPAQRPCPWVGCKHNLFLDINPVTGSISLNFPELEPWMIPGHKSCSLDVADLGGLTLEGVGEYMNLTRERIRQVEVKAYMMLREHIRNLGVEGPVAPGCASTEPHADGENNTLY